MNRRVFMIVAALWVSALAVPLTLHEQDLRHIRDSTFAAVRFAATADPAQLSQLPVARWEETEGAATPGVRRIAWGRYEMRIPRVTTTVVADIDLRPTLAALLLGAGGWLRVIASLAVGGGLLFFGLRCRTPVPKKNPTYSISTLTSLQGARHALVPSLLLKAGLDRVSHPALVLNSDHRLVLWNAAIQDEAPHVTWSPDVHLLDLATILPWGKQLLEAVDDHVLRAESDTSPLLLIIKEGGRVCVTAG